MFASDSGPYNGWKKVGELIRRDIAEGRVDKSKGFVCVSAHWESEDASGNVIEGPSLVLISIVCRVMANWTVASEHKPEQPAHLRLLQLSHTLLFPDISFPRARGRFGSDHESSGGCRMERKEGG